MPKASGVMVRRKPNGAWTYHASTTNFSVSGYGTSTDLEVRSVGEFLNLTTLPATVQPSNDTPELAAVKAMFTGTRRGAIYSITMSNCFQDAAGTQPVTALGQYVMRLNDVSGNGMHLTQTDPALAYVYTEYEGKPAIQRRNSSSFLRQSTFNMGGALQATVSVGARKTLASNGTEAYGVILGLSNDVAMIDGSFEVSHSAMGADASRRTWSTALRGATYSVGSVGIYAGADTKIVTSVFDFNRTARTEKMRFRLDRSDVTMIFSDANTVGSVPFGNYPLYLGSRGGTSSFFNGYFFGGVIAAWATSTTELNTIETFINQVIHHEAQPLSAEPIIEETSSGFVVHG